MVSKTPRYQFPFPDVADPVRDGAATIRAFAERVELTIKELPTGGGGTGEQGPPGPEGPEGPEGPRGPEGPKGDKGDPGADGAKGDKGDDGADGAKGDKGDDGATGADGKSVTIAGTVANVAALPVLTLEDAGDGWITADTGDLHVWSGTEWTNVGKIEGPRGPAGADGPKGDPGAKGDPGTPGAKGDPGTPGAKGDRGIEGPRGTQGDQGPRGLKGDKGDQGPQGPGSFVGLYASSNLADVNASGTQRTIVGSISIPDPGFPYVVLAHGVIEAGHFETVWTKAVLEVCVGSVGGSVIARGFGPNEQDWRTVPIAPYTNAANPLTGNKTLFLTLSSPAGDKRQVRTSTYFGTLTAAVYRAP